MPSYDYICRSCTKTEERFVSISESDSQVCDVCGEILTKEISPCHGVVVGTSNPVKHIAGQKK